MALHTKVEAADVAATVDIHPHHTATGASTVPRWRMAEGEIEPRAAYQIIHDELMLDGNSRLNLATFVTTWMEPEARLLIDECLDKNMIDKDEYPQTAELENRCVNMLADLWGATADGNATGCSTTGSSEACMLAGMALKRRWRDARRAATSRTWSWAPTSRSAGRSSAATGRSRRGSSR